MTSHERQQAYDRCRDQGVECTRLGRLDVAREWFAQAVTFAEGLDETVRDRAFCNVVALEIELQESVSQFIPRLRAILTKDGDLENCRLSAYHLARAYDLRKEYKKALFYSRVAIERSERTGFQHWLASSHNQMGNILIAESRFAEGKKHLETALALVNEGAGDSILRALIQGNLGYCHLVEGDREAGFRELFAGFRSIRRDGAEAWESLFHMSLCFGYLEIERLGRAHQHGIRALELAQKHGDATTAKNCLFLLGEVASVGGDMTTAHGYFSALQERYYPQHEFLPDFLLAVDVRGLVNLKA